MKKTSVTVYGLGYVGLTLSIVLAESGYYVYGIDIDKKKINYIRKNKSYLYEKNIDSRIKQIRKLKKIDFLNYPKKSYTNYHVICVGTPINKNKKPILSSINNVLKSIIQNLQSGQTIILRSTVPVGFTRKHIIPKIYKKTKLRAGIDYNICFAPERTIEGKALEELKTNPQIIGGYSKDCLKKGISFFEKISDKIIKVNNLESAEIAKLIDNTFRDTIFAYSNEISLICDKFSINAFDIIKACNSDYIRNNIPSPSPGVGGACLSKDPYIMLNSAKDKKLSLNMIKSSRIVNEKTIKYIAKKILFKLKNFSSPNILVCGLTFKGYPENTDVRNSTSIDLINHLKKNKRLLKVDVYDPVLSFKEIKDLKYNYYKLGSFKKKFHCIIFANNHKCYVNIGIEKLIKELKDPKLICDCWNLYGNTNINTYKQIKYFGVGF